MNGDNYPLVPEGWRIADRLGRGSCGSVYRIIRTADGAAAALKIISIPKDENEIAKLRQKGFGNEAISAMFERRLIEIYDKYGILKRMSGESNIVRIDDVTYICRPDGSGCEFLIRMEELIPLRKTLDRRLSEQSITAIAEDILTALVRYEQFHLIHGAIKPENILVSNSGVCKLSDFGVSETAGYSAQDVSGGVCDFLAPEIFHGLQYDRRADVYSVGLILFWLCNNCRLPFLPDTDVSITAQMVDDAVARRLNGEPIPAPRYGSRALKRLIATACSPDPAQRYQSAAEMLLDLRSMPVYDGGRRRDTAAGIGKAEPFEPTRRTRAATQDTGAWKPVPEYRDGMQSPEEWHAIPIYQDESVLQERSRSADTTAYDDESSGPFAFFRDDFFERRDDADDPEEIDTEPRGSGKRSKALIIASICALALVIAICVLVIVIVTSNANDASDDDQNTSSPSATATDASGEIPYPGTETIFPGETLPTFVTPDPISVPETTPPPVSITTQAPPTTSTQIEVPDSGLKPPKGKDQAYVVNYDSCKVYRSWQKKADPVKEGGQNATLKRNAKVTIICYYEEKVLVSLDGGKTPYGWIADSFLFNGWMTKSANKHYNPGLNDERLSLPNIGNDDLSYGFTPKKTITKANFRWSAKNDGEKNLIETVEKGTKFTILYPRWDPDSDTKWYFCMHTKNGAAAYGWVHKENFVAMDTPEPSKQPTPSPEATGKVIAKTVAIHTSADENSSTIKECSSGELLTVYCYVKDSHNRKWYYVKSSDGKTGFIFADYVTIVSGTVPPSVE